MKTPVPNLSQGQSEKYLQASASNLDLMACKCDTDNQENNVEKASVLSQTDAGDSLSGAVEEHFGKTNSQCGAGFRGRTPRASRLQSTQSMSKTGKSASLTTWSGVGSRARPIKPHEVLRYLYCGV